MIFLLVPSCACFLKTKQRLILEYKVSSENHLFLKARPIYSPKEFKLIWGKVMITLYANKSDGLSPEKCTLRSMHSIVCAILGAHRPSETHS